MALTGSLTEVAVADVIQLISMGRKTGVLTLVGREDRALIYFDDGRPVHAAYGSLTGEDAVYAVLALNSGDFSFEAADVDCPRTISEDAQGLVLEGMRRLDHWRLAKSNLPPGDTILEPKVDVTAPQVRADLSEQELAVLALVGEQRAVADILRLSELPEMHSAEALWRLMSRGLVGIAQPGHPQPTQRSAGQSRERELAASDVRRIMDKIAAL
ncbi:MAG: DUF4388 domain-containing protein [Armatimonadota bacterium]